MGEPTESLVIATRREGAKAVVSLEGELDLYGSPKLVAAVADALAGKPEAVEIDAEGLTFADSAGLRAFLIARKDADAAGATFSLTRVSEPLDRVLEMTGLREALGATR
jgi:anti-sigma B factor antagonist